MCAAQALQHAILLHQQRGLSMHDAERQVLGFTDAELGGALALHWNFPSSLADAVARHNLDVNALPDPKSLAAFVIRARMFARLARLVEVRSAEITRIIVSEVGQPVSSAAKSQTAGAVEELDIIAPAVAVARTQGIQASGPYPPDTVFMRARHAAGHPAREATEVVVRVAVGTNHALDRQAGIEARVEPFLYQMDREMRAADVVICRAGATTLAELQAAGRASILIPLPTATDDHQRKNARALVEAGAARMIDQASLSGEGLAREVLALADARTHPEIREKPASHGGQAQLDKAAQSAWQLLAIIDDILDLATIDEDAMAQACLFVALAELVATYGEIATAKYAEKLPERIRNGEFTVERAPQ